MPGPILTVKYILLPYFIRNIGEIYFLKYFFNWIFYPDNSVWLD
jgi:hypothetical protein